MWTEAVQNCCLQLTFSLQVIKCLLIVPFPESALNDEAGKQFMEDYEGYFKTAKLMTDVHARRTKPRIQEQGDVRILETPGKEGGTSKVKVFCQKNIQEPFLIILSFTLLLLLLISL